MHDARLRRVRDPVRLPHLDAFDPEDELHVEAVSGRLLEMYWEDGDVEAFALLCELTRTHLLLLATRLVHRLGLDAAPDRLVQAAQRRLFLSAEERLPGSDRLLLLARGLMLQECGLRRQAEPPPPAAAASRPFPDRASPARPRPPAGESEADAARNRPPNGPKRYN